MKRKIAKIGLVLFTVILLSAGCNKKPNIPEPQASVIQNEVKENVNTAEVKSSTEATTKENAGEEEYTPEAEPAPILTVDQKVEGSSIINTGIPFTEGQTAYDVLAATHKVLAKDYGAMGKFVQSIDGRIADSKHFWEFWINGKSSYVGASSYKLQNGDKLEWKLTELK